MVQRKPVSGQTQTEETTSGAGGLGGALRGMSFDEGQQALAPPPGDGGGQSPVQMRGVGVQMKGKKGKKGKKGGGNRGGGGGGQQQQNNQNQGGGGQQQQQQGGQQVQQPTESGFQKVVRKLGEVATLDNAFEAIGGLMDTLAPIAGQGFSGQLDVKIKPPLGGGFYMNLNLEGTAKRNSEDKLEVEGKIAVVVGAVGRAYFFDGYVGARGALAVKATGDAGYECMRLMGLGLHNVIGAWSPRGASWIFGQGFEDDVVKGMKSEEHGDKADSLEFQGEVGVEGGIGGGNGVGGGEGAEGKLAAGYRNKTKVSKEKDTDTKSKTEVEHGFMTTLGVKGKAGGFELEGGIDIFVAKGKPVAWELKAEIAAESEKLAVVTQVTKSIGDIFGMALGTARSLAGVQEKAKGGEKTTWAGIRTALGGMSIVPKVTIAAAMHDKGKNAPVGTKAAFEVGLKFEDKTLKEFTIEALQKFEPPEGMKESLGMAGVELGGKQSTSLVSVKK
ncbi:MAG: hypothetical protein H6745_04865 [Deltaproteobacteria bacterium]|nr:hypothetical protein [Deltaproteobacteria bacterium]